MTLIAQVGVPTSVPLHTQAESGSDIAHWADSSEKTVLTWIGGTLLLIAILVVVLKMKRDAEA